MKNYFARKLRLNQTEAERRLWYFLRNRCFSGVKFRRQHPIDGYIVDFCCIEKGLIVELDGGQHATQQLRDQRRTQHLKSKGYRVLRFWDHDVLQKTNSVIEVIRLSLDDPHSEPLPGREYV
ncbi:MAG: hypothetical protein A3G87_04320 [Omnitrophica bacterium RIFCSPLOWO2_12_FULL_50_11]|nr:MAG: hypothetical protein A3G87_04320 [Omnitrophica bacterium RIFCSPLOWO2_12_FULL_50_11]